MKRLKSIFTDDMDTCYFQKRTDGIERHHIFGAANRKRSEEYGFVIPLHYSIHPNGAGCQLSMDERKDLDVLLKQECQKWFLEHIGGMDRWMKEFGRNYL